MPLKSQADRQMIEGQRSSHNGLAPIPCCNDVGVYRVVCRLGGVSLRDGTLEECTHSFVTVVAADAQDNSLGSTANPHRPAHSLVCANQ